MPELTPKATAPKDKIVRIDLLERFLARQEKARGRSGTLPLNGIAIGNTEEGIRFLEGSRGSVITGDQDANLVVVRPQTEDEIEWLYWNGLTYDFRTESDLQDRRNEIEIFTSTMKKYAVDPPDSTGTTTSPRYGTGVIEGDGIFPREGFTDACHVYYIATNIPDMAGITISFATRYKEPGTLIYRVPLNKIVGLGNYLSTNGLFLGYDYYLSVLNSPPDSFTFVSYLATA